MYIMARISIRVCRFVSFWTQWDNQAQATVEIAQVPLQSNLYDCGIFAMHYCQVVLQV